MLLDKEKLLLEYGFSEGNYKYLLPGAELFRYIGLSVLLIEYDRKNNDSTTTTVFIKSISDYNPGDLTYSCKFTREGKEDIEEIRIMPEGFFINEEKIAIFNSHSNELKKLEDLGFYNRLSDIYNSSETMDMEVLKTLCDSKEQDKLLKYAMNIGALVVDEDKKPMWIRFHGVKLRHKNSTKYSLYFEDFNHSWTIDIDSQDKEYNLSEELKFKILDLSRV